jgi:hypothetical protein
MIFFEKSFADEHSFFLWYETVLKVKKKVALLPPYFCVSLVVLNPEF